MVLSIVQSIRDWFAGTPVANWLGFRKDDSGNQSLEEHIPVELPDALHQELAQAIQALNPHPCLYRAIADALDDALHRWNQYHEAPNSLVILGSPSDELHPFVHRRLEQWLHQNRNHLAIEQRGTESKGGLQTYTRIPLGVDWDRRPHDYQTISGQLQAAFQQLASPSQHNLEGRLDQTRSIILLPLLDDCFLRCMDGFDAIEQVQMQVLGDRTRFWVLGCNHWAWQYLEQVCQISTYFEQTFSLPPLSSDAIKEWLAPVMDQVHLEVVLEDGHEVKQLQLNLESSNTDSENGSSKQEQYYFEKLESRSQGLSRVAADLWLRSLSVPQEDPSKSLQSNRPASNNPQSSHHNQASPNSSAETSPSQVSQDDGSWDDGYLNESGCDRNAEEDGTEEDREDEPQQPTRPRLKQNVISLPSLPILTTGDRYLLYSILLHGQISVTHLATSLGERESHIQAQAQVLLRAGLINRQQDQIKIDPSYYLSIRADLERNNFLVGEAP